MGFLDPFMKMSGIDEQTIVNFSDRLSNAFRSIEDIKLLLIQQFGSLPPSTEKEVNDLMNNEDPSQVDKKNRLILNDSFSFNDNAVIDSTVNVGLPLPDKISDDNIYQVHICNPSTETGLVISCLVNWKDKNNVDRYSELTSFPVEAGKTVAKNVQGLFLAEAGQLSIQNDTAVTNGFAGFVQIREL